MAVKTWLQIASDLVWLCIWPGNLMIANYHTMYWVTRAFKTRLRSSFLDVLERILKTMTGKRYNQPWAFELTDKIRSFVRSYFNRISTATREKVAELNRWVLAPGGLDCNGSKSWKVRRLLEPCCGLFMHKF